MYSLRKKKKIVPRTCNVGAKSLAQGDEKFKKGLRRNRVKGVVTSPRKHPTHRKQSLFNRGKLQQVKVNANIRRGGGQVSAQAASRTW